MPEGNPVTVAPVAPPPTAYVMGEIFVPGHTVWLLVPVADVSVMVAFAVTVTVIRLLVTETGDAQVALEVIVSLTTLPLVSPFEANVALVPASTLFTNHW